MITILDTLDEKFIVINKKRFQELNKAFQDAFCSTKNHPAVDNFISALNNFNHDYKLTCNRSLNQKYIVCNQDEPYAKRIAEIILNENYKDKEND